MSEARERELNLAMTIRMLCSHTAGPTTRERAMELLRRYGLQGSPLRADSAPEVERAHVTMPLPGRPDTIDAYWPSDLSAEDLALARDQLMLVLERWIKARGNAGVPVPAHQATPASGASVEAALSAPGVERLRDFYRVGPVQRAAVESFADALAAGVTEDAAAEPKPSAQGPDELWLQLHGDCHESELDSPVDYTSGDVTWCWHKIHDSDVRYVRSDLATLSSPTSKTTEPAEAPPTGEMPALRRADDLTAEEVRRGYGFRQGVKVYCCYGMYAGVGHSNDCKHAAVPAEANNNKEI